MFSKGSLVLLLGLLLVSQAFGGISRWRVLQEPDTVSELDEADGTAVEDSENTVGGNDEPAVEETIDVDSGNEEEPSEEDNDDGDNGDTEDADEGDDNDDGSIDVKERPILAFACRFSPLIYDPTCASNGKTYASRFELRCAREKDPSITEVECDPSNPFLQPIIHLPMAK